MDIEKLISARLKGLRGENDYSRDYIANKLKIHRETYRRYEKNPYLMNAGMFIELLNIYGLTPSIFFNSIYGK